VRAWHEKACNRRMMLVVTISGRSTVTILAKTRHQPTGLGSGREPGDDAQRRDQWPSSAARGHEACQGCPARLVAVRRLSGGTRRCSGRCRRIPTPSRRPGSRPWSRRYPTQVRPVRDDRAVVRSRLAPATDPLGRQQALPAQQAEDPFPAHLDLMLATEPGADLAVALASERRGDQHLVDQPEQVAVADRGCRTRPDRPGRMSATSVERGAGRAKHPAHHRHRQLGLHGYLGRFAGGIWSPLVSDAARRISFSMVSCPILRRPA
jgi:hypothetical protein